MDVIMFKELSESLVNPITKIINLSVFSGDVPMCLEVICYCAYIQKW